MADRSPSVDYFRTPNGSLMARYEMSLDTVPQSIQDAVDALLEQETGDLEGVRLVTIVLFQRPSELWWKTHEHRVLER